MALRSTASAALLLLAAPSQGLRNRKSRAAQHSTPFGGIKTSCNVKDMALEFTCDGPQALCLDAQKTCYDELMDVECPSLVSECNRANGDVVFTCSGNSLNCFLSGQSPCYDAWLEAGKSTQEAASLKTATQENLTVGVFSTSCKVSKGETGFECGGDYGFCRTAQERCKQAQAEVPGADQNSRECRGLNSSCIAKAEGGKKFSCTGGGLYCFTAQMACYTGRASE